MLAILCLCGCRASAPIHVWQPPGVTLPASAKIAIAPVVGHPDVASRIERAILAERPTASADIALFTADQLAESSPIRLVSTASLQHDSSALQAARIAGADILLSGEVLSSDIVSNDFEDLSEGGANLQSVNMNHVFFQRLMGNNSVPDHRIMLSWRILDVSTARTLAARAFSLDTRGVDREYPDLTAIEANSASRLIAASGRETWKILSPIVVKEQVELAVPWLQFGAWRVRQGVRAAKRGDWQTAEAKWRNVTKQNRFSAAAQHNLAIAMAAREDFSSAKIQLRQAAGILGVGLPHESLFWLDTRHRLYHQAHGLAEPADGWAFPDPPSEATPRLRAAPIDVADLPWWTAIPFTKPPQWTWQAWLKQASPFFR